jgi:hypothetical protein
MKRGDIVQKAHLHNISLNRYLPILGLAPVRHSFVLYSLSWCRLVCHLLVVGTIIVNDHAIVGHPHIRTLYLCQKAGCTELCSCPLAIILNEKRVLFDSGSRYIHTRRLRK